MGHVRPPIGLRGSLRRSQHPLRPQVGAHLQHQPLPRTPADLTRPHGYRYRQVLLHLHSRSLCLRLR